MLSIIIPVYNAVSYLETCMASAVLFMRDRKEIILVDDGSTDGSGALCDHFVEQYREEEGLTIEVIHFQENRGVSAARNAGLEKAQGDWVWMIDADDFVEDVYVSRFPRGTSMLIAAYKWSENGKTISYGEKAGDIPYNLWRCWFRRDIIKRERLTFTEGRKYAEDQEFILKYLLALTPDQWKHIFYHQYSFYIYYMREGSAMTRPGVNKVMARDLYGVICSVWKVAWHKGKWHQKWVLKELKRLVKNLIVVLRK